METSRPRRKSRSLASGWLMAPFTAFPARCPREEPPQDAVNRASVPTCSSPLLMAGLLWLKMSSHRDRGCLQTEHILP